jgi:MFS family permease
MSGVAEASQATGLPPASPSASSRRPLQMLMLAVTVLAATYARTALGPLQEAIRSALDLNDNQMALLQGPAQAIPVMVGAVGLGLLVDRYSRVRLLLIFSVFSVIGSVFTALASNFALLVTARCLIGLTQCGVSTAAYSLLADFCTPEQRGRGSMIVSVSQMGGNSGAFALGGLLLAMSGPGPQAWRWAMFWLSTPLVVVIFLMLAMREPPRTGQVIENPSTRQAWPELWHYRSVIAPLLAGLVMAEIAFGAAYVWAAPALSRSFGLPPERVGAIMGIGMMLSGIVGPVVGGPLADLCQRTGGPRRTILVLSGLALLTVPTGLFAFVPGIALACVLLVLFIVIVVATLVMGMALFTVVIPSELLGLCMGIMFALDTLFGFVLAPVAISLLSGAMGGPIMIGKALALVGVGASAVGATAFAFGRQYFPRKVVN